MNPTRKLHQEGQSLWLDNITRELLTTGTLRWYIDNLGITGLTSNPTIFDQAFLTTSAYDDGIRAASSRGLSTEDVFFTLAIEDLRAAADLFRPTYERTHGLDGWVSLEVSPLLAYDPEATLASAIDLYHRADRPNFYIKIPATARGLVAIEEAIFAGIPVNVTLLFDRSQYLAAANAYLRGIERRVGAGLDPAVGSVASVFISRWDTAHESIERPDELHNRLGIAMASQTYGVYRDLLASPRWERLANDGALPQRLLWASTGTKDEHASDVLYVRALAAPLTVNTMPEKTLLAFSDHGEIDDFLVPNSAASTAVIDDFLAAGVDLRGLAERLQAEAAQAFERSWHELLENIESKSATLSSIC